MKSSGECAEVFIGIDVGKEQHYVQAVTVFGVELFDQPLVNDQEQIEAVIDKASKYGGCVIVVDTTASNVQLLLTMAQGRDVRVAYVSGLQMRRAADLYAGYAKTDPKDAWVLADYARRNLDRLTWLEVSDEVIIELKVLNGRDTDLAADANKAINRCRDAMVAVSPALERVLGPKLGHAGICDLLQEWATPSELKSVGKTRIRNLIKKRSPRVASKLADLIWEALLAQTVVLPAETVWGEVISDLMGDLERIISRRGTLMRQIESVYLSHPLSKVLDSLCGFGTRTGARTLAEIGDPHRFANGSRLASYAGLAPIDRKSGKSINNTTQSHRGNHRLKNAMFLSAFIATQHDPEAKAYYETKRSEGKKHNAAIICTARKRCDLILAMLKNQVQYQPQKQQQQPATLAA